MTTDDVRSLGPVSIVALTLWGEARGEPIEGRIGVACVIRNRVRAHTWFGDGYDGVCLAPQQFSCWNAADPNCRKLFVLAAGRERWLDDPLLAETLWIAEGVVTGRIGDRVGDATHYHAASMLVPPAWTEGARRVGRVGGHLFFAGVK
jgi:N-acetylmuramoyl-L-alanine amidase